MPENFSESALFLKTYVKSMRRYYSFINGIAGWLGVSFYEHIAMDFRITVTHI
jgi:hypothetical protein